jgi:pimeloyl-ACP methyl ester carboxylesterase
MRQLASLLAEAGVDTHRFDYYATGDSGGNDAEGDLAGRRQDILTAVEELTSLSGATRVTLIGLRLGATLAAHASRGLARTIDGLVLWDPVTDGHAYVQELYALCRTQPIALKEPPPRPASEGGGFEILGFPLTQRIHAELQELSLGAIAQDIPCPIHVVISGPESECERVRAALAPASPVTIERIANRPIWLEDWPRNSGAVPVKILQQIVPWVAQ